MLTTDKFILLHTTVLDIVALEKGQDTYGKILMYEFETGQINEVSFVNDDGDEYLTSLFPFSISAVHAPKNMFANMLIVSRLKKAYENKQLRGELEKLVAPLDVEDNPVVAIYKFK
jgi:hypothetical protein